MLKTARSCTVDYSVIPARFATIPLILIVVLLAGLPAIAAPSDTGVSLTSFNESEGCPPGIPGPRKVDASTSGSLSGAVISGPWGDFFGRNKQQIGDSIVWWNVDGINKTIRIHERVLPAAAIVDANLSQAWSEGKRYSVRYMSTWVWRTVGGSNRFSEHAIGTAIDINAPSNPYSPSNTLITDMPPWFTKAWIDAGFCWGGIWVNVKDAMHYSWSGPGVTPGYTNRPGPYPPLTSPSPYSRTGFNATVVLGPVAGAQWGLADFTGDGSADLYRLRPYNGGSRLEVAGSQSGFTVIGLRKDLPFSADDPVLVGDRDYDGRPDLWVVDDSGGTVKLNVRHYADGYATSTPLSTGAAPADDYSLTLYDNDWLLDLVTIDRSGETSAVVWSGASGYTSQIATFSPGVGDTTSGWSLLFGDWDVNGVTDLYAVPHVGNATVRIQTQGGAIADVPTSRDLAAGTEVLISDYDGDGRDDLYFLEGNNLTIALGGSSGSGSITDWFIPDEPVLWDAGPECVGPQRCDRIGYVDDGGEWTLIDEVASVSDHVELFYGNPGDIPFFGDWNCDGIDTPGLYRQSDGYVYLRNSNTQGVADLDFFFGNPGDAPIVGDFNGDGCDTVSIYRASQQRFYIVNHLGDGASGLGAADYSFIFGNPGDTPFTGDFDGDDIDEVALHRPTDGFVYLRHTLDAGPADVSFFYGDAGDIPVAGDWNGDGTDTVAVYRPGDGNWYLKLDNATGVADHGIHFHAHTGTTRPVVGAFDTSSGG